MRGRAGGLGFALVALVMLAIAPSITADETFYQGKTLRIVVGYSPGGTADADARLIARHLPKHIPGNPNIIVQNVPGAGGIVAINLAYKAAKPDGLSIFQLGSGHYLLQMVGKKEVQYDLTRMPILGAWATDAKALFIRSDTPYRSIEDIRKAKEPPIIGTHGRATLVDIYNIAWQEALGIKLKLIPGYESAAQFAAVERGEVHGRTNSAGASLRTVPHWIKENFAPPVVQAGPERDPRLGDTPTVYDLNPNPGAFYEAINTGLSIERPYVLPPGTPPDRVAILRQAWQELMKDEQFIANAEKLGWAVTPTSYEKIEVFYKKAIGEPSAEVLEVLQRVFK